MADTVRDAFRSELQSVMTAQSITWPLLDTLNNDDTVDAATSYITLEFLGGDETPFSFGDPGNNVWREHGVVLVNLLAAAGTDAATAEAYARTLRAQFRNRRFLTSDSLSVRILTVSPFGGGLDERLAWSEAVALEYRTFNIG